MTETMMNYGTYGAPRRRSKNAGARREAMAARRSGLGNGPSRVRTPDPAGCSSDDDDFGEPVRPR